MKLNKKNAPVLSVFDKDYRFMVAKGVNIPEEFKKAFGGVRNLARKNRYIVSSTMVNIINENGNRLLATLNKEDIPEVEGSIYDKRGILMQYAISPVFRDKKEQEMETNGGVVVAFYGALGECIGGGELQLYKGKELHYRSTICSRDERDRGNMEQLALFVLCFELFKKYADIETVEVYNNQRKHTPDRSDVIENKSGMMFKYVDSLWLKEIIRTEGFKVSGHFRLQPCKVDGEWTKKLIYINEYEKHGYHRRSGKEIAECTANV